MRTPLWLRVGLPISEVPATVPHAVVRRDLPWLSRTLSTRQVAAEPLYSTTQPHLLDVAAGTLLASAEKTLQTDEI